MEREMNQRSIKSVSVVFFTIVAILLVMEGGSLSGEFPETMEKKVVLKVISSMRQYYERRRVTSFLGLFSRRKFPSFISFKRAVEDDFNMNTNISLRKTSERLSISHGMAVHQAMWEKQYRTIAPFPYQGRRLKRVCGHVRIYLEKEREGWKVINLHGYPIFGL